MEAQKPTIQVGTVIGERTRVTAILNGGCMVNVKGQTDTKWTFKEVEKKAGM